MVSSFQTITFLPSGGTFDSALLYVLLQYLKGLQEMLQSIL